MEPKYGKDLSAVTYSNCKLWTTICLGVLCIAMAVLLGVVDPVVLMAKYKIRMAPGSPMYELMSQEIESVHLSLYLFNITNAERFVAGDDYKLKVEDIGPFTYKEIRRNLNLAVDSAAGLMRYKPQVSLSFVPEESIGDPEKINVTMPNLPLLSMTSVLAGYPYIVRAGVNLVIEQQNTKPIISLSVQDLLWGYQDPLISLANKFFPNWIYFDKIGVLDRIYEQKKNRELILGNTNEDKFQIKTMDGLGGLDIWDYQIPSKRAACNSFNNVYEGFMYPTDMTTETPVRIYRTALCRFLDLEHLGLEPSGHGYNLLVLQTKNNTFTMDEENKCLCSHGICVDGMSDISPCYYGLPLVISNAHFTGADPALTARVEGLLPDAEKYQSRFVIEPTLGMALGTSLWIQISLKMADVRFNSAAAPFTDMVVPIGYLRMTQPPLPQELIHMLGLMFVTLPRVLLAIQILLAVTGLSLLAYSSWCLYSNNLCPNGRRLAILLLKNDKNTELLNEDVPAECQKLKSES